jgi:FkbM family methyltransferase
MSVLKKLIKAPLIACVDWEPFRRRTIFELQRRHYADLGNRIPLGGGLTCPLLFPQAWDSFAEIFVHGEYARAFDYVPLPDRWIDLGCHAGFFSLYVVWRRACTGEQDLGAGLLVDADSRMSRAISELISLNGLAANLRFAHGIITSEQQTARFHERSCMASSAEEIAPRESVTEVRVLTARSLMAVMSPPYDLVKVDIEGAEYDFVTGYEPILQASRSVLLEWHSWTSGAAVVQELTSELARRDFCLLRELSPGRIVKVDGAQRHTGLLLFQRSRSHG